MTEREKMIRWERMKKDKEDYKFYKNELKYFCKIAMAGILGYIIVGATMAIFS